MYAHDVLLVDHSISLIFINKPETYVVDNFFAFTGC